MANERNVKNLRLSIDSALKIYEHRDEICAEFYEILKENEKDLEMAAWLIFLYGGAYVENIRGLVK